MDLPRSAPGRTARTMSTTPLTTYRSSLDVFRLSRPDARYSQALHNQARSGSARLHAKTRLLPQDWSSRVHRGAIAAKIDSSVRCNDGSSQGRSRISLARLDPECRADQRKASDRVEGLDIQGEGSDRTSGRRIIRSPSTPAPGTHEYSPARDEVERC